MKDPLPSYQSYAQTNNYKSKYQIVSSTFETSKNNVPYTNSSFLKDLGLNLNKYQTGSRTSNFGSRVSNNSDRKSNSLPKKFSI